MEKVIGANKVFIIAEIGINHNGDLSTCKKLVYEAKKSGADAVKLQIINLRKVIVNLQNLTEYSKKLFKF